ncbi:MAG: NADH-quinone oxidoreductase subunit NuoK [Nitrospinota bacterium]|jgi:NADH-quinone oxidoreductase subunit K|nr:NADH-quinone oxidoreductase subunit NuoK [Nitrospinota bacterium]
MGSEFVLFVSAAIFSIGALGFVIRKNPLVMFMSVELMLNAVNFLLIGYSSFLNSLDGQIFALIIMTVAAAEVVVGLAIILTIFRTRHELDVDRINTLKG